MIVVDASLALKLALNEADSDQVRARWQEWTDVGEPIIAPPLFRAETASVLRGNVYRGVLTAAAGERAFALLEGLAIETREPLNLYREAWNLANRFNRPTVYDCCYLALAAITNSELWTADRRLANAVRSRLGWVHMVP
ncbi:MAG: type II toxin-antitoxin system VapC family toxin [Chloroflexota bacterium]